MLTVNGDGALVERQLAGGELGCPSCGGVLGGWAASRFVRVPATECEIIDTWTVGGLRGTGSHDVVVRDAFVPTGNQITGGGIPPAGQP